MGFMHHTTDPFKASTGSDRLASPRYLVILFLITAGGILAISRLGMVAGVVLLVTPLLIIFLYNLYIRPITGLYTVLVLGFVLLGSGRYIPDGIQIGLVLDSVLLLTYIALLLNRFYDKVDWKPAKKDVTLLAFIWFGYSLLQFFNPEVQSRAAWFAGVRGISVYMLMIIPLVLLFFNDKKKLDNFLIIWGVFSILASLKGIIQVTLGPDPFEQKWLETDAGLTHIIFGNLRAFSFMSDAGQFGANQAYSAVVATIVAFAGKNTRLRLFFLTVAGLGFLGMFLSGTRGAISIPLAGFFLYFVLRKNVYVMISGVVLLIMVIAFFKFTYIGQDNQFIRRMRSSFDPNDPSLQVRFENQKKLKTYLASRPFGGGIGHAGVKAKAYTPNSFLSNIATDSWYVLIWAEQGIVGLILHLFILFYIIIKAARIIMFRIRDPELKIKMAALASGMMGVIVASYGNAVLGTMPTSILIYFSMALMLNAKQFDIPEPVSEETTSKKNKR
ncbi:MAG: O-antigen ligase family protein [Bacteroidetes bacterium]|nr:O-antigen ligase family protein [Bacteroidota bacterium]